MRRSLAVVLSIFALAAAVTPALGVTSQEIYRETRCPTCNTPLDISNSPAALDIKEFIAVRVAKGQSEDQILDALVAEFGREVLATPPKSGFDLALTRAVSDAVPVPVIASGGVGTLDHLADGIQTGGADAVLAASIFHYGEFTVGQAKQHMAGRGIPVRL